MRGLIKALIPESARKEFREKQKDWALRKAIRPLREKGTFTTEELDAFHRAWGNEGFSADKRYLSEVIRLINLHKGPVLECGTGGTTIVAAVLGERLGFDVYSLEQDPQWSYSARRAIKFNALRRAHIRDTPLKSFGSYLWYDTELAALPQRFGLVICDGPYIDKAHGEPAFSQWRYGVLPFLEMTRRSFGALLLDDVNDPHKRAEPVIRSWSERFGVKQEIINAMEGDCAVITP